MEAPLGGAAPRPRTARPPVAPAPPPGSVPGDPARQLFSFRAPKRFYVDAGRRCRTCGAPFVFTAREQKRWYEVLGLSLGAGAARCATCRRSFLRAAGVERALADAARALSESPLHPAAVLAYARAAVSRAERTGHAPLAAALAALAALRRHGSSIAEALFWEGRCREAAGRRPPAAKVGAAAKPRSRHADRPGRR